MSLTCLVHLTIGVSFLIIFLLKGQRVRRAFCQSTLLMAFGKQRKFRASRALFETIIVGQRSTLIRSSGYELDQIVDSRIT